LIAAASVLNVLLSVAQGFSGNFIVRLVWALVVVPFALSLRRRTRGEAGDNDGPDAGA
jgi:hypothetical protein